MIDSVIMRRDVNATADALTAICAIAAVLGRAGRSRHEAAEDGVDDAGAVGVWTGLEACVAGS